jgi:hypothetical protein
LFFDVIHFLSLSRYILTVAEAEGAALCNFAGEIAAFETQPDTFAMGARGDLAEFVFFRDASRVAAGAFGLDHPRAFFAGDSAHADSHGCFSF